MFLLYNGNRQKEDVWVKQMIIYKSRTGFTKCYAQWLCEALKCDCVSVEEFEKSRHSGLDISDYDVIIFGSSFRAGTIEELKWYRETILPLGKINVVFITGAMPASAPEAAKGIEQGFTKEERENIKTFYLQSGLNYEKMGLADRLMMKMFCGMLKSKKGKTEEEKAMAELVQKSFDYTDPANMEPMLNYLQGL